MDSTFGGGVHLGIDQDEFIIITTIVSLRDKRHTVYISELGFDGLEDCRISFDLFHNE